MDAIVVRRAEPSEMEVVAALRWRWVIDRGCVPVVTESEFVDSVVAFAAEHEKTHHRFVAVRDGVVVGMAWLAVLPRVPSPRALRRASGDVQCVYVVPEERNAGVGSRLMGAVLNKARQMDLEHLTVHSSPGAIGMYERNGFESSVTLLFADFGH